ncbi:hypothetical protein [Streptomyces fagopyri]|uniref:hypothetical protein n=1 Tax=Streptomyces fagopyri TaxID=2662397 RepID=UPI00371B4AED
MGLVVEQKVARGDHLLKNVDGVDDWCDGDPGNLAFGAGGSVVAVLVGGGLVFVAADQVPSDSPVGVRCGIGAAAGPQSEYYWREGVIPTMRYSG